MKVSGAIQTVGQERGRLVRVLEMQPDSRGRGVRAPDHVAFGVGQRRTPVRRYASDATCDLMCASIQPRYDKQIRRSFRQRRVTIPAYYLTLPLEAYGQLPGIQSVHEFNGKTRKFSS